ncbi:MAG: hypothetical protein UHS51_13325 [Atopobiaceae bacterium]|nr:hypothetical protein [Atopobiaceae bacterium]
MSSTTSTASPSRTSRKAGMAFPICMAILMVYGMELYNHLLMGAPFAPATLLSPFSELVPMAIAVLVVEKLFGGPIVAWVISRIGDVNNLAIPSGIILGTVTCLAMCPLMSMVATLVFKHPTPATVIPLWFGTFVRNLPFALAWALLVARPISSAIVRRLA